MSIQMLAFGIVQYLSNDKYKLWSEKCYRIEGTAVFSYVVLSPGGWKLVLSGRDPSYLSLGR